MGRAEEIAREQEHVSALYQRLDDLREQTRDRLTDVRRRGASGTPQARSERDAFAAMYEDRLAQLEAVEPGLCFGRLDLEGGERIHVGRIGLTDERHDTMLVDWRAPAAEPFYRATPADAHGVVRRRHLRTKARAVLDVEDDVFDVEALTDSDRATLGGGGALLAAVSEARTGRMRDIVATIQSEQDRVIRAEPTGVLVVQGGPGTGKTAVALHRAAYLLYTLRERLGRSGVLVVGPGPAFLRYIEQVLPSLGETGVLLATLGQLLPDLSVTATETDEVAALKADPRMADVVEAAVAARQRVPQTEYVVAFEEHELVLTPSDVAAARSRARRSRHRHNRARYAFARHLLRLLVGRLAEIDPDLAAQRWVTRTLMTGDSYRDAVDGFWPRLAATDVVRELFTPEGIGAADGILTDAERRLLLRPADAGWSAADVPLVDEAWALLGDPEEMVQVATERRRLRAEREYAQQVVQASGLGGQVDADRLAQRFSSGAGRAGTVAEQAAADPDWEFGHVIVDEAQELSPMAWRMLRRRCPNGSMTVVGDVDQLAAPWGARRWSDVLTALVGDRWRVRELTVNYRTPSEIMAVAGDVLAAVDPMATVPTSVRDAGTWPLAHRATPSSLVRRVTDVVADARVAAGEGRVAVIVATGLLPDVETALREAFAGEVGTGAAGLDRAIYVATVAEVKGLEFDAVVVVEPSSWTAGGPRGLRELYVALTRATQRLDVVHTGDLPGLLSRMARANESDAAVSETADDEARAV